MAKRRRRGDGSLHLRKDGRWEGRYVVGRDEKGFPITKNVLAKTKAECAAKLEQLRESLEVPTPEPPKPGIGLPGHGMDGRGRDHIAARAPIVQAGGKPRCHGQGRVVTLEVVVDTSAAGQTSPCFGEGAILLFQVCKGFVPKLPCIVGGVHIQHHQAVAGGNSDIACTAAAPPFRNLRWVCGGVFASVRSGWDFSVTGEYPKP